METDQIIDPALPIIDSHHHLWSVPHSVGGRGERPYLAADLASDLASGHNVRGTVFVECDAHYRTNGPVELRPVGETEFVVEQAASISQFPGACAGIVGFADLTLGNTVGAVLDAHIAAARGRFRGIRQRAWYDDDAVFTNLTHRPARDLLDQPSFREGFAELARRQLSFDAFVFHPQLDAVGRLAQAFPDTPIIVNHLGGLIGIGGYGQNRKAAVSDLQAGLDRLAIFDNVFLKLGGLGFFLGGSPLLMREPEATLEEIASEWEPLIRFGIQTFGADRCMFESNFPVDYSTCSYATLWNVFKVITRNDSARDRRALFAETARNAYRLPALPLA